MTARVAASVYDLSPERERELVAGADAGDEGATAELVSQFLPKIGGVARLYRSFAAVDRSELIQEGVVGLMRASKRFDPKRGTPFWAYASWWVRQAMQQLVAELTQPVVLSDRAQRRLARIKGARQEHLQAHGSEPSTADLATATELSAEQVESLIASGRAARPLDEPLGGEEGASRTFGDLLADPAGEDGYDRVIERTEIDELRRLSAGLGDRERLILYSHYGLGRPEETLRQIAERLELSVERVRQIEARALDRLREAAGAGVPVV